MTSHERASARRSAEEIYVLALSVGGEADVAALAKAHPALAAELADIDRDWRCVAHLHALLVGQESLATRLRRHYGENVEADLELEDEHDLHDSMPSRVVRELEAEAPRHSRYRLLGEVARGGMGAVLKVWDAELRRALAMKVMHPQKVDPSDPASRFDEDRALSRFLEEAQVTSQLDHPGIVPVHEMGLDATGRVFFTMRLVRGRDLEHILGLLSRGEEGWTVHRALRVLQRICEAMAFAHSKAVVHRDLKPANVMVGRFGEVYVMDWGLARVLGREDKSDLRVKRRGAGMMTIVQTMRAEERQSNDLSPLMTMDGEVLGTPAYMSPEQALGDLENLDQRADVYSVGAILYHLLAGHMPYVPPGAQRNAYEVLQMVQAGPPEPLHARAPKAPAELVAIAEKALARRPQDRYPSMIELAEDLTSFLDGHVVRAYETGAAAELRKWVRRNRATAASLAAAVVLALGGLASIAFVQVRAKQTLAAKNAELELATDEAGKARDAAEEEKRRADESSRIAQEERSEAVLARADAEERALEVAFERDSGEKVIAFLVQLFESPDPSRARGAEITAKELLDRGARALAAGSDDERAQWSRLRVAMGRAYHSLGLYADAEPLLARAVEDRRAELGPDAPETLRSEQDLGSLYLAQGRYAEAEPLLLHIRARWADAAEPDEAARLETADALGLLRFYQGRYKDAVELLGEAVAGRSALLGEDAPMTLRSTRNLALVHRKEQRYFEAQELLERVLAGLRVARGADHPETLQAMNDLAGVYVFLDERERALPLFEEALAGRVRLLGEKHPDTLITLNDLAYLHLQNGDFEEAEPLYEQAIEGKKLALGATHPETLTSQNNLAALYYEKGRYAEAEALYAEVLEGTLATSGEEHPHAVGVLFGLASAIFAQGRLADAAPFYERAYRSARTVFGESHENTQVILESYVRLAVARRDWEAAEPLAATLVRHTPQTHVAYAERKALLDEVRAALAPDGG